MRYNAIEFLERLVGPAPRRERPDGGGPACNLPPPLDLPHPSRLPPDWHFEWDERAAILEYDAGFPREHAEAMALAEVLERMRSAGVPL